MKLVLEWWKIQGSVVHPRTGVGIETVADITIIQDKAVHPRTGVGIETNM